MVTNADKVMAVDKPEFWERLYQAGAVPWDIGQAAPPLKTFLESPYTVPPGAIAVVGCGNGHDCMLFASKGFSVTGIDFSPTAIQTTYQKFLNAGIAGKSGFLLERDVFGLFEYGGYFDYVCDHNFFSSIDPSKRRTYARAMRDLLKPGGKLMALWWTSEQPNGPPFGIAKDALYSLCGELFTFDIIFEPTNSVASRKGKELFTLMTRKA